MEPTLSATIPEIPVFQIELKQMQDFFIGLFLQFFNEIMLTLIRSCFKDVSDVATDINAIITDFRGVTNIT